MESIDMSTASYLSQGETYLDNVPDFNTSLEDAHSWIDTSSYSDDKEYQSMAYIEEDATSSISPISIASIISTSDVPSKYGKPRKRKTKGHVHDSEKLLDQRRAQNRESQKRFREKNAKAYEDISQALQSEKQITTSLRAEVDVLQSTVASLGIQKQNCLEAIQRLQGLMSNFPRGDIHQS